MEREAQSQRGEGQVISFRAEAAAASRLGGLSSSGPLWKVGEAVGPMHGTV